MLLGRGAASFVVAQVHASGRPAIYLLALDRLVRLLDDLLLRVVGPLSSVDDVPTVDCLFRLGLGLRTGLS